MNILRKMLRRLLLPIVHDLVEEKIEKRLLELSKQIDEVDGLAANILLEVKKSKLINNKSNNVIDQIKIVK
jgi:hypothetical protein